MVEVFKTDVAQNSQARLLIDLIGFTFAGYQASFDLEDCDRVLRVSSLAAPVCSRSVIRLLENFGYAAALLDEPAPAYQEILSHH